jgi:hypothetical protein
VAHNEELKTDILEIITISGGKMSLRRDFFFATGPTDPDQRKMKRRLME